MQTVTCCPHAHFRGEEAEAGAEATFPERKSEEGQGSRSRKAHLFKHFGGHLGKNVTKGNMYIPFTPAIPRLGIFPKKITRQLCKDVYESVWVDI